MRKTVCILGVLGASGLLLSANPFLSKYYLRLHDNDFINGVLHYQLFALLLAVIAIWWTLKGSPESKRLLKFGNWHVMAGKEKWLGINGKSSWKKNALQLCFFISLATAAFMFMGLYYSEKPGHFQLNYIPLILLVSLSNSFSEEMIYRFSVNGNLSSRASKTMVLMSSAVLFGLPHYFGFPSGIIGVMMSGALGFILSKATYETEGLGIAWGIHFIQDIIIFSALMMMNS